MKGEMVIKVEHIDQHYAEHLGCVRFSDQNCRGVRIWILNTWLFQPLNRFAHNCDRNSSIDECIRFTTQNGVPEE